MANKSTMHNSSFVMIFCHFTYDLVFPLYRTKHKDPTEEASFQGSLSGREQTNNPVFKTFLLRLSSADRHKKINTL